MDPPEGQVGPRQQVDAFKLAVYLTQSGVLGHLAQMSTA